MRSEGLEGILNEFLVVLVKYLLNAPPFWTDNWGFVLLVFVVFGKFFTPMKPPPFGGEPDPESFYDDFFKLFKILFSYKAELSLLPFGDFIFSYKVWYLVPGATTYLFDN